MPETLDLLNQKIHETYHRVVQVSDGKLYNGKGELVYDLSFLGGLGNQGILTYPIPSGTTVFLEIDKILHKGVFIDYVLYNNFGQRTGTLKISNFNNQLEYNEMCTNDLGSDTASVTFSAILDTSNILVRVTAPNSSYTLKVFYKYI